MHAKALATKKEEKNRHIFNSNKTPLKYNNSRFAYDEIVCVAFAAPPFRQTTHIHTHTQHSIYHALNRAPLLTFQHTNVTCNQYNK